MPEKTDLRIVVICSSNQNRSMEAHSILSKKGFNVRSFGSGNQVKLPGPSPSQPNTYDFSVTYDEMYQDLLSKDKSLYTTNGILHMLDRNRRIKPRPERFQLNFDKFDVIFTCEERVYDQVVEGGYLSPEYMFLIVILFRTEQPTSDRQLACPLDQHRHT